MKKQFIGYPSVPQDDAGYFYKATEVDARMACLEVAREGTEARMRILLTEAVEYRARIAELEHQLAMANDAAAKGDLARANAGGMEMRIAELEAALREAKIDAVLNSDE